MKTLKFLLILCIINSYSQERYKASDFNYIGIEHNENVENVYSLLINSKVSDYISAIQLTQEYFENYIEKLELESSIKENLIDESIKFISNKESINLLKENYEKYFDSEVIVYLYKLDEILKDSKNKTDFDKRIKSFEEETFNNLKLDNKALAFLYSTSSVAKNSIDYWIKNGEKWHILTSSFSQDGKGFWQGVWDGFVKTGTADVQGAVGGAAFAAAYNFVPGGGQVAYGATIIATAAGNSVMSLFN